jgi:hypothetical protein
LTRRSLEEPKSLRARPPKLTMKMVLSVVFLGGVLDGRRVRSSGVPGHSDRHGFSRRELDARFRDR